MGRRVFCEAAMNSLQVSVQGTLREDGTLELKEAPRLPPGPVEVVVRALPSARGSEESWLDYLQRGRTELLAQGYQFRTREEIDADRAQHQALDLARQRELDRLRTARE
jgi:hypothetical protein